MYVKILCPLIFILVVSICKSAIVDAQAVASRDTAPRSGTMEVHEKKQQDIEAWLQAVNARLEEHLTRAFWSWWQEDQAHRTEPEAPRSLDKLAYFKETQHLLKWLQGHLEQLEDEQIGTLWGWTQKAEAGQLGEQQVQMLRAWRYRSSASAPADAETAMDEITRLEQTLAPTSPTSLPHDQNAPTQLGDAKQAQAAIARLEQEHQQVIQQWMQTGKQHLPALESPFGSPAVVGSVSPECLAHLQKEIAALARDGVTKETWLHHVFDCDTCCAPLLANMMEAHVAHVTQLPHTVVLFDFDTSTMHALYQQRLNALMQRFDKAQDTILLIGRASQIGDRAYNFILSGKRAGEIKDYLMDKFALEESQLRYLYFGYDPPQLTLEYAKRYGITAYDLASIDTSFKNSPEYKINQSAVVVIYKASPEHSGHR